MAGMKVLEVDKDRMMEALKKRGLTMSNVSKEIGFEGGYLSKCCERGKISIPASKMLESLYHLNPEEYKPIEVQKVARQLALEVPEVLPVRESVLIDYDLLAEKIAEKIGYQPINYQKLFSTVFQAIRDAIYKGGVPNGKGNIDKVSQ